MLIAFTYDRHNERAIHYGIWDNVYSFNAWAQRNAASYPNAKAVPQRCLDRLNINPEDFNNILLSDFLTQRERISKR